MTGLGEHGWLTVLRVQPRSEVAVGPALAT